MNRQKAAEARAARTGTPAKAKPAKVAAPPLEMKSETSQTPGKDYVFVDAEMRSETDGGHANQEAIGSVTGTVAPPAPAAEIITAKDVDISATDLDDMLPSGGTPLLFVVLKAKVSFKSKPMEVFDITERKYFITHALRLSGGMVWFDVEIPRNANGGRFVGCVPVADVKVALYSRPRR